MAETEKLIKDLINALLDYSLKMDRLTKAYVDCINELNKEFNAKVAETNANREAALQ